MNAPQIHPGEICLIMATRGRPECWRRSLPSLKANTAQKDKVSLWLYVDEDDAVTRKAIDSGALSDAGVAVALALSARRHRVSVKPSISLAQFRSHGGNLHGHRLDDALFRHAGLGRYRPRCRHKISRRHFSGRVPSIRCHRDTCTYPIFGLALAGNTPAHFPRPFSVLV